MTEAHAQYARWGAESAMTRLERACPDLLRRELPAASRAPVVIREDLDMRSERKASQALSGEIVLSRLLEALMRIMLGNAGARRGFLILKHEGSLTTEAAGDVASDAAHGELRTAHVELHAAHTKLSELYRRARRHPARSAEILRGSLTSLPR